MKWLMSYQIDSAQERRVQQKTVRAAAARCHEQASNAAINACLKEIEARSAPAP
ncbi:general secretion pathway protein GspL [Variovorax paradoxus]|nr:general secretion pathway protein GspL [Variovorax paradoxus]